MSDAPIKTNLHPKNRHNTQYDLPTLVWTYPALGAFIKKGGGGHDTVNFSNPAAVKALNTALLYQYYAIKYWELPENYLCPPVPGRSDYIHYAQELISAKDGQSIHCLDIGTGASLIYPILATHEYQWTMVCSEIDPIAITSAQAIIDQNERLKGHVIIRKQTDGFRIFQDIVLAGEKYDLSICNPPFYKSAEDANKNNTRKLKGLHGRKPKEAKRNFEGQPHELWTEGGEKQFLKNMIYQSEKYKEQVAWFTSLVSREDHLQTGYRSLERVKATEVKTIDMSQGNKKSRILAWRW